MVNCKVQLKVNIHVNHPSFDSNFTTSQVYIIKTNGIFNNQSASNNESVISPDMCNGTLSEPVLLRNDYDTFDLDGFLDEECKSLPYECILFFTMTDVIEIKYKLQFFLS